MSNGRPRPPSRAAVDEALELLDAGHTLEAQRTILADVNGRRRNRERPGTVRHAERELELLLDDLANAIRADLLDLAARVARRLRRQ